MLRGCAQAVVDAPLAQKLALREDFARMELDVMKECSALFDARRPRPRPRAGRIIPKRLSASQAASQEQRREAEREQKDDECLEDAERLWRTAKAADNTAAVDVTVAPPPPLPLAAPPAAAAPAPARRTSKRVAETKAAAEAERQADAAAPASAAARLDAVNATLEACRASRAVVAAKREDKKRLRAERAERKRAANAARCQCPSTCVLGGMVPSCRRL